MICQGFPQILDKIDQPQRRAFEPRTVIRILCGLSAVLSFSNGESAYSQLGLWSKLCKHRAGASTMLRGFYRRGDLPQASILKLLCGPSSSLSATDKG